jgi:SAM-dependent methyltransferase
MSDDIRTELRRTWELAAPGWAKWEGVIAAGLSDVTETMLDTARVGAGMRVLDLACGTGSQILQAAARVGPKGWVVAIDISATMLRHVREAAARRGLANIETLECAAEDLPQTLDAFDAAISRFGLMLFPAPKQALTAVQRVLKPKARIAVIVFTTPSANTFMSRPMQILLRYAGKEPPAPGQPGIFALGGSGVLEGLLADSGVGGCEGQRRKGTAPAVVGCRSARDDAAGFRRLSGRLSQTSIRKLARRPGQKWANA